MSNFLRNRRRLNEIRLARLADLIESESPLTYGEAEEVDQETSLQLMFHNSSLLSLPFMSSKIKALITDVVPVSIKDKDMKPTILLLNAEHFADTFQGTLENFEKVLGKEGALSLMKAVKAKFREQDPEKMKDVISEAQIADEKQKWPNAEQWQNLVRIIKEVAAMKAQGVITPKSYNRYQLVAGRIVDAVADETTPFRGDANDAAAHLEAITSVLLGTEPPASVEEAAKAVAGANGKKVETKTDKKAPASTEQLPNPPASKAPATPAAPANLPATPAQLEENPLFGKIADNIRQRMEDLKADEASIDIIEQQLTAIKQRAGRERGSILEDLQSFFQAVQAAPTATAAVAAGAEVATPETPAPAVETKEEVEEEVGGI